MITIYHCTYAKSRNSKCKCKTSKGVFYEVTNPPIEAVITFKNDRMARDTKLYFYYLYTLERRNIKLLTINEEFDEGSEFANIYRALLQFVAERWRRHSSKWPDAGFQCRTYHHRLAAWSKL